jgi:iron complex outermembrane receptor protein
MTKQVLIILFLFQSMVSFGQTGSVTGSVFDADTDEPLIGVTILIKGATKGGITNLDGVFSLKNVTSGNQTLVISYIGYANQELSVDIKDNVETDAGKIQLQSESIGLKEIEIFSSVIDERKTPVAVTSISALDMQERFSGASIADITGSTAGVNAIQGAGGYGDSEIYIRGFDQSNVAFLVNGIPVNDMENGRMFWSNFAGLSDVTRQMQVQRGLGASKLAISSIGGTVNMITKPAERSEGGRVQYETGTGSWNQRTRFSYNTGESNKGWAFSLQGSRTTTNQGFSGRDKQEGAGVRPGAFTDAWSYYLAVSKKINEQHQLLFWAFGAPVNRGTAWTADEITRDAFQIDDVQFNNALGVYKGDLFNMRQNKSHKPTMALSHYWDIDPNTSVSTSVYYSSAKVYSTQPKDVDNFLFFAEGVKDSSIPANIKWGFLTQARSPQSPAFLSNGLINFDYLASQNRSVDRERTIEFPNGDPNISSITGFESQYFLEARFNNHNWVGLISNFRKQINNINVTAGVDLRKYKGSHYAEVFELFGGDFITNISPRSQTVNGNSERVNYNKLVSNQVLKKGDRTNYDYDAYVDWAAVFGQVEYNLSKVDIFGTATFTNTGYQRQGNFWNGRIGVYEANSFGLSEKRTFNTYTLKAGASYHPTNRHNLFVNVGRYTRPPFFRNAFFDARYSNEYQTDLTTEKITSGEVGYSYRSSIIKVNINGYYTVWKDRTTSFDFDVTDQAAEQTELPFAFNGLESLHKGLEMDFVFNATSKLEFNGFASLGDWHWNNNPTIQIIEDNGAVTDVTLNIKDFPVGAVPQTTVGLGVHYSGIRDTYVGARWQYSDKISVRYSPDDILEGFIEKNAVTDAFDDFSTLQIYAGRYIDFSEDLRGRVSVSVQNVFDTEYVRWASYFLEQAQNGYGFPRTYTIGFSVDF